MFYKTASENWGPVYEGAVYSDYWGDAAYLAERVLTITELKHYVDDTLAGDRTSSREDSAKSRVRSVLARRLMREGRRQDALAYFDDAKTRGAAQQYDDALSRAKSWWRLPHRKAEAWFAAAVLARKDGMEILGYEKTPDFAIWSG